VNKTKNIKKKSENCRLKSTKYKENIEQTITILALPLSIILKLNLNIEVQKVKQLKTTTTIFLIKEARRLKKCRTGTEGKKM